MNCLEDHKKGIILKVKVKPRASKSQIREEVGEHLKIFLKAVPEKGKANKVLLKWLKKKLALKNATFQILSGKTSREKKILITGISRIELAEKLNVFL